MEMRDGSAAKFVARILKVGLVPKRLPLHYADYVECRCMVCGADVGFTPRLASHRVWRHEQQSLPLAYGCRRCTKNGNNRKQALISVAEACGFLLNEADIPMDWHSKTKVRLLCSTEGCDGTADLHYNQLMTRADRIESGAGTKGCADCSYRTRRRPNKKPVVQTVPCAKNGCRKDAKPNGYCGYHWRDALPEKICIREGCDRLAQSKTADYCASDYAIFLRDGRKPLPPVVVDRICEYCGAAFRPSDRKQRFCSMVCTRKSSRPKYAAPDRTCQWCGTVFQPKTSRERSRYFCSNECRNANRAKELRKEGAA